MGRLTKAYFAALNRTINPLAVTLAKSGRGPFSLIRHVGRKSGRTFETPVILADSRGSDDLVAELTYGDRVNWYRNILVGGGEVVHRGRTFRIVSVEHLAPEDGLRAFAGPRAVVLRLLRRHEFRIIRVEPISDAEARAAGDGPTSPAPGIRPGDSLG